MLSTPAIIGSKAKVPDPPTGLTIGPYDVDGTMISSWNAVSGATKYEVRFSTNGGAWGSAFDNGTSTSRIDGYWNNNDYVCIQVQVTTSGGTSGWSSAVCAYAIYDDGGDPDPCGGGHATCLTGDTLITMADNYKRIADVKQGDMILNGDNIPSEVEEIVMTRHDKMIKILFTDGSELDCTVDHPWFAEGIGWVSYDVNWTLKYYNNIEVNKLEVGQTLVGHQNKEIESITPYTKEMDTYQITKLSVGDTYFANGMLTKIEQ